MEQIKGARERIMWVDVAKGLGMLCVILGHSLIAYPGIAKIIYSFHMPLFFILSGCMLRPSRSIREWRRRLWSSFKRLIPWTVAVFVLSTFVGYVLLPLLHGEALRPAGQFLSEMSLSLLFSSSTAVSLPSVEIGEVGPMWFPVVIFFARSLFDGIHLTVGEKWTGPVCILCTLAGVYLGGRLWLPFSFDIVLTVMIFFCAGFYLSKIPWERYLMPTMLASLSIWLLPLLRRYFLDIAIRAYAFFPVSFLGAIAGSVFVCCLSTLLTRSAPIQRLLCFLGRESLPLFYLHALDFQAFVWLYRRLSGLPTPCQVGLAFLIRVAADLAALTACVYIRRRMRIRKAGRIGGTHGKEEAFAEKSG